MSSYLYFLMNSLTVSFASLQLMELGPVRKMMSIDTSALTLRLFIKLWEFERAEEGSTQREIEEQLFCILLKYYRDVYSKFNCSMYTILVQIFIHKCVV